MICTRCGSNKHVTRNCPLNMRRLALVFSAAFAVIVAGCASAPVKPSGIRAPSARLMVAPKQLPEVKDGDDLVGKYLELRDESAGDKERLRSLQGYVRTLRGK